MSSEPIPAAERPADGNPERARVKRGFHRIGLAFFLMMLIAQLVAAAAVAAAELLAPDFTAANSWFPLAVSYGVLYLLAFPVFLGVIKPAPNTLEIAPPIARKKISPGGLLLAAFICLGVVYPLNMLTAALSALMEAYTGQGLVNPLLEVMTGGNLVLNLICVVGIAPVMEEIVFRGILLKKLAGYGGRVYAFFSAFLFALFHANLYQIPYAFVLGVVFAMITWHTGGIRVSIVLHMVVNAFGGGVSMVLMAAGGEAALIVWGAFVLLLSVAGLITGIVWFTRNYRKFPFGSGAVALPSRATPFANAGVILYIVLVALLMAVTIVLPYFTGQ